MATVVPLVHTADANASRHHHCYYIIDTRDASDSESESERKEADTQYYDKDFILGLNRQYEAKVVHGYLRQAYTDSINPHSIDTQLISAYYHDPHAVFLNKYLLRTDFCHISRNSVHIERLDSALEALLACCKPLYPTLICWLMLMMSSWFFSLFLGAICWSELSPWAIGWIIGCNCFASCALCLAWRCCEQHLRYSTSSVIYFNADAQEIQRWRYILHKIWRPESQITYSLYRLIAIERICGFEQLRALQFQPPRYNCPQYDADGKLQFQLWDAARARITSITFRVMMTSDKVAADRIHAKLMEIMQSYARSGRDRRFEEWPEKIQWIGF